MRGLVPLLMLVIAMPAAEAGTEDLLYFTAEQTTTASPQPPVPACGTEVRTYRLAPSPVQPGRAYGTFSFTMYGCYTAFETRLDQPISWPGPPTLSFQLGCDQVTPLGSSPLRVSLWIEGQRYAEEIPHVQATRCEPDEPLPVLVRLGEQPLRLQAGSWIQVVIQHSIPNPDPALAKNLHVLVGGAQGGYVGLQTEPVQPGRHPDRPGAAVLRAIGHQASAAAAPAEGETGAWWSLIGVPALLVMRPRWRGFLLGLFARLMPSTIQGHPLRAAILQLLRNDPGACEADMQDLLEASRPTLRYHLSILQAAGEIREVRIGRRRHYFTRHAGSAASLQRQALLRHPWAQDVVQTLRTAGPMGSTDLARQLSVSAATLHWRARRLHRAGLLQAQRTGGRVTYRLTEVPF